MSGSSDTESESSVELVEESKWSLVPLISVMCVLCYVYGMWLGMYLCPK